MERERAALVAGQESQLYAHPRTHQFLVECVKCGLHMKLQVQTPQKTARMLNIVGIYFGTNRDAADLGRSYDLSRERIRQILEKFVKLLWNNAPLELQRKYPLEEMIIFKPRNWSFSDRLSQKRGGKRASIREFFKSGITKSTKIAELTGLTNHNVSHVLSKLRKRQEIEQLPLARNKLLLARLKSAQTNQEIAAAFEQVRPVFFRHHRSEFVSIARIAWRAGFRLNPKELGRFLEILTTRDIHYKKIETFVRSGKQAGAQNYYIVLPQQQDRVRIAFETADELAPFRQLRSFIQVAGPEVEIPSTTLLCNSQKYRGFFNIARTRGLSREDIFSDCPVAIFRHKRLFEHKDSYLVKVEDLGIVVEHIESVRQRRGIDKG